MASPHPLRNGSVPTTATVWVCFWASVRSSFKMFMCGSPRLLCLTMPRQHRVVSLDGRPGWERFGVYSQSLQDGFCFIISRAVCSSANISTSIVALQILQSYNLTVMAIPSSSCCWFASSVRREPPDRRRPLGRFGVYSVNSLRADP